MADRERVILIAEDDGEALASWDNDIREFNRDAGNSVKFFPAIARSRHDAMQILDRMRISCAVVDLRLPADAANGAGPTSAIGNDVLERLLLEIGVPAVVYSGHPQEASVAVKNSRINVMQKRGGGGMAALKWLAGHEGLMFAMSQMRHDLERKSAFLFGNAIWPRWQDTWQTRGGDVGTLATIITRQVVAHVSESLNDSSQSHHPEEFYFDPPLSERLQTGDMIRLNGDVCIVVTPRCNLSRKYPKHIMLGICSPMVGDWDRLRKRFLGGKDDEVEGAVFELRNLATQGHAIATHFLPPKGGEGPWLLEFKNIMTVPSTDVPSLLKGRFASIAPQFIPNLVQRYATYLGRIGQPDLDQGTLRSQICS